MAQLSELTFQKIIDNLPTAIIIVSDDGVVRLHNQQARVLSPGLERGSSWASAGMLFHTDPEINQGWMNLVNPGATLEADLGSAIWQLQSQALNLDSENLIQITASHLRDRTGANSHVDGELSELKRSRKLLEITQDLSYLLEEELVLEKSLQLLNESFQADEGRILLKDEITGEFVVRVQIEANGKPELIEKPTGIWPNQGLAGWVLRTRQATVVADTEHDKRWIATSDGKTGPLRVRRSVLAAPLEFGHEPIGVVMLTSPEPNRFSEDEFQLLKEATGLISNALYNAHLYDLIRNQGARLGGMLREEQVNAAKNQSILESIADGVLVADQAGEMVLANDAFIDIFEIPRWQVAGKHVSIMGDIVKNSGADWLNALNEWAKGDHELRVGAGRSVEDTIVLATSDRTVRVSLAPVFAGGQFFGTVSIFRDITREIEADLAKTSFISLVSHELRTPLTSIRGYTELMLMGAAGALPETIDKYVKIIQTNAKRLHELVGDILLITQFDSGDMPLSLLPVDVGSVIDDVVNNHLMNRINVENRQVTLSVECSNDLPQVMADRGRVVQILTNLVDNALNYTPDPGEVTIVARQTGSSIFISVRDTGIGIAPGDIDEVFNRFYRSEDISVRKVAGTGLGLSIAETFVEMHGGRLTVSSEYGVGSTFTFNLPISNEDMDSQE